MDDYLKKLLEQQEQLRRFTNPLGDLHKHLTLPAATALSAEPTALSQMLSAVEERNKIWDVNPGLQFGVGFESLLSITSNASEHLRLLSGPLEDYTRLGFLNKNSPLCDLMSGTISAFDNYKNSFRLPHVSELSTLAQEAGLASEAFRSLAQSPLALDEAMASMRTPWLYPDHVLQGVRSFAEIQAIGQAVNVGFPYDVEISSALRSALGDWRQVTEFPNNLFSNVIARSDFYVGLGFNSALTDFTAAAFDETTALAGIGPLEHYRTDRAKDDEEGLARTNKAHDQLQRFERKIRRFIDTFMTKSFGSDWVRQRTPGDMFKNWKERRDRAVANGEEEQPLIAYADFTDYKGIIERRDNWAEVFKPIFGRLEDVQESFMRLFPIRLCTMHSRIIVLDDELLMQVETRRIMRAIDRTFIQA